MIVHLPKLAELLDRLSIRFELLDEAAEVLPRVVDPADDLDAPTRVTFLRDSLRGCFFIGTVRTRGGGAGAGAGGAAGAGEGFRRTGASSASRDEAKDAKSSSEMTRRFFGGAPDNPEASRAALALRRLL